MFPDFQPPAPYTGELYGIEYLLHQSGNTFTVGDVDSEIDEGFEDMQVEDEKLHTCSYDLPDPINVPPPTQSDSEDDGEVS